MKQGAYVERALFVLGNRNAGKSTQLRSMFLDRRLGTEGRVPTTNKVRITHALSNERWLHLRLTSPHESGETLDEFLDKCTEVMQPAGQNARRWNFAGALQLDGTAKLAGGADVIADFIRRFLSERVRAVILSPNQSGNLVPPSEHKRLTSALRNIAVEIIAVDATSRTANGLIYASFFDFA
jgi:hypothetical protein